MGTPQFAVPALRAVAACCEVAAVVTPPDRPRGRGLVTEPAPVAATAEALGLPVLRRDDLDAESARREIAALGADFIVVVAFGAILGAPLLGTPRLGCVNLHASLLPEYRGASPVQRALWDGRGWTGVTTLWMDEGIDTGDLILQRWMPIEPAHDAGTSPRPASRSRSAARPGWATRTPGSTASATSSAPTAAWPTPPGFRPAPTTGCCSCPGAWAWRSARTSSR